MGFGMNFNAVEQLGIASAMRESGITLTQDQVRFIAEAEAACLADSGRVSFGESAAVRVVREFSESPFIFGKDTSETLIEIIEGFYDLRGNFPASISDTEILEEILAAFDGDAAGDVDLAVAIASEELLRHRGHSTYEIADAGGTVYRWDPEEWRDDITADGWNGEKWDAADE